MKLQVTGQGVRRVYCRVKLFNTDGFGQRGLHVAGQGVGQGWVRHTTWGAAGGGGGEAWALTGEVYELASR